MIIEVDRYKKKIAGYSPKKSEQFHVESARLADKDFVVNLKTQQYRTIVFMAGCTASGKTEYAKSYLRQQDCLVYDGTLKKYRGFQIKLQKIARYCKNKPRVKVVYIIPYSWNDAYGVFNTRERKMNWQTFFDTYIGSAETVSTVFRDSDIEVEIYASRFDSRRECLTYTKVMSSGVRTDDSKVYQNIANKMREIERTIDKKDN